jgi:N-acyl-D-aspartate/D-glutamate deacylase
VITLPWAIHAMTALPAQIIGLKDRGLLREGYKADITIFNLELCVTGRPRSSRYSRVMESSLYW